MKTIIKLILSISVILMFMLTATQMMSKKTKQDMNKSSPFECGFTQMSSPRKSFSIQFFYIALIFLIFDVELSILMPMIFFNLISMKEWTITSTIIVTMLILGLAAEWNKGLIEWTK